VGTTLGPKNELWVYRQAAGSDERVLEGRLRFKRMPYLHSFGLTPRHALIIEHPFTLNPLHLLFSNRAFIDPFQFDARAGTRLWKLERETGRWTSYLTESLFCFHTVNAFEDGQDTVFDFLAFDDPSIIAALKTSELAQRLPTLAARYVRARLSPGKRHVELERLSDQSFELPNIAYRQANGHAYDTVWGATLKVDGERHWEGSLVRVDLARARVARFGEPGMAYGEPVFVPRPGTPRADAAREPGQDGVLL
jgi:beta,beta-carotene 9',10'-dioxygenase